MKIKRNCKDLVSKCSSESSESIHKVFEILEDNINCRLKVYLIYSLHYYY